MTLCIDEGVTSKLQAVIAQLFSSLQLFALCKQKKGLFLTSSSFFLVDTGQHIVTENLVAMKYGEVC